MADSHSGMHEGGSKPMTTSLFGLSVITIGYMNVSLVSSLSPCQTRVRGWYRPSYVVDVNADIE